MNFNHRPNVAQNAYHFFFFGLVGYFGRDKKMVNVFFFDGKVSRFLFSNRPSYIHEKCLQFFMLKCCDRFHQNSHVFKDRFEASFFFQTEQYNFHFKEICVTEPFEWKAAAIFIQVKDRWLFKKEKLKENPPLLIYRNVINEFTMFH